MRRVYLAALALLFLASSASAQWPYSGHRRSGYRSPYRVNSTFSQTPFGYARSTTFTNPFGSTTLNYGVQPWQQRYINHSYGGYVNPYGFQSGFQPGFGQGFQPGFYSGFGGGY